MLLSFYAIQDVHAAEAGNSSQFELIYEDMFFNIDVQSSNKNFSSFDAVSFSKNDTEWHFPDGDTFEFIPINHQRKIIPKQPTDNIFLSHQIFNRISQINNFTSACFLNKCISRFCKLQC